jgi:hypothetical protein
MKTPLLIALTAGLSLAVSSAAVTIYQGNARNTADPTDGKANNYKATLYLVVDEANGNCAVYEAFHKSDIGPSGAVVEVKKKYTKLVTNASFSPETYGDYKLAQCRATQRWAGPFSATGWFYGTAKKNGAYQLEKATESWVDTVPASDVLYSVKDNGGSFKPNKGMTKDWGTLSFADAQTAMETYLVQKKKYTAL